MAVDASAVARVLGITTQFKDLRAGGALLLPQRLAILAQGASDSVFSTDKFQITSAPQAGERYGWGSPIHLIARQLFPQNGDGIGTVPVTVYPLEDDAGGVAAAGDITPSGSQTEQASYVVKVNNIVSEPFVLTTSDTVTTICAKIGEAINAVLEMPVKVTYTYDTLAATPDGSNTGDGTVDSLSTTGTPTPGDYTLECTATAADGGTFKLVGPDGTDIATGIDLTAGAQDEGGIGFTINDGATDFEVGDSFVISVPATDVQLTAKWKGASGNDLYVEVEGEDHGVTFVITQPTGGMVNPDVQNGLDQVGNVWETMGLNAMEIADTSTLDKLKTFGDGRWGTQVRKPIVFFTGNTETTVAAATAVSSGRRTDKVNAQLVAPGSKDLPFVVAARQLARIARVANNNPPRDYGSQKADGLTPGADGDQWDFPQRDQAVKAGSSTVEVKDGVVHVSDVVTFYRPTGEPNPAYRYVCDIVKVQNILFNLDLIFAKPAWNGAPLIPDDQPTVNPDARKPKQAIAAINALHDSLGLNAIISNPEGAKASTTATIDSGNPKRLNWQTTVQIVGNTNIISGTFNFGFYYGEQAVVAA